MEFSAASLFAAFLVSTVGLALYLYGKKQTRVPPLVVGIAMMVYPCFITSAVLTYSIAGAMVVGLWFARRMDG